MYMNYILTTYCFDNFVCTVIVILLTERLWKTKSIYFS